MKHLLNVLYVLTPHSELYVRNQTICLKIGGDEKISIPVTSIDSIVCFGVMSLTTPFVDFCGKNGVSITLLSEYGRFCGRFCGPTTGNVLLRRQQYRLLENEDARLSTGINIIGAKLKNSKIFLLRAARDAPTDENIYSHAINIIDLQMQSLRDSSSIDELRGYEGVAANTYFGVFNYLLRNNTIQFSFDGRNRRPPRDEINAALSFAYTLLTKEYVSALESFGIDPAVGIIHSVRPGRPALALDLMEELRVPLADRFVLSLINRKQLNPSDFDKRMDAVFLNEKGRKTFLAQWQERKNETIIHPYLKESIKIGLIPFIQSQLYGKYIRGELSDYPPFIWR